MPSRNERVYVYASNEQMNGKVFDFPIWWDRRGFFEKFGSRKTDTNHPLYVDYAYLLTSGEAIDWDKNCTAKTLQNSKQIHDKIKMKMDQFSALLKESKWVIVESYEWDSGL